MHLKYTLTQTDERCVQKQWEQVPLVYFLCAPNVGPGGGPQLNHSRHAVEREATTLTSLKGAIDTHRITTQTLTHTYIHMFSNFLDSTVSTMGVHV